MEVWLQRLLRCFGDDGQEHPAPADREVGPGTVDPSAHVHADQVDPVDVRQRELAPGSPRW